MKKLLLVISYYLFIFLLGCGGGNQTVNLNLKCDNDCNDNNAVVITIYQLKNADKFRYASFESLLRNPEETLSGDLIPDSKYETTLVPGQSFRINSYSLKTDAQYLGIVGNFHSPAKDGWMQLIPINQDLNNMKIIVHHNSLSVENSD